MGILGFTQYGTRTGLYQDKGTGLPNHSMYKLNDLLALGAALENLDPTFSTDALNALIKADNNVMAGSYEGVREALKLQVRQARPMMEAVAINSSSKAREILPDTEYGSSSGFSAYLSKMFELILDMLTCPIVQPPKRRSEISS